MSGCPCIQVSLVTMLGSVKASEDRAGMTRSASSRSSATQVRRPPADPGTQSHLRNHPFGAMTPAALLALQRTAGNQAVSATISRQSVPNASTAPQSSSPDARDAPTTTLTNDQLLAEIARLERAGSTAAGGAESEARYQLLTTERTQRIHAGHIWLADSNATDLLSVGGSESGATIGVPTTNPHQAGPSTSAPIFSRGQLDRALAQHGVAQVDLGSMAPTAPAAGAVPGPSMAPQLLGRFYPFQRAMTDAERLMVAQRGALHYTTADRLPNIVTGDGNVGLDPSRGYRNLADPAGRRSSYFFAGEPSGASYGTNMAGRAGRAQSAVIVVQAADLPAGTLFRPVDGVLAVPGGYQGRAQILQPGQPVPAGSGAVPATGGPTSMADQLRTQGSFSGHPLAAGVGSGVIAMVLDTGIVLVQTGDLPSASHLAHTGMSGTAGGVVGAVTEQAAARTIAGTAVGQSTARMFVALGRGGAGAVGGFVAAPIVEMGRMALDDEHTYTGTDYAARGTRAAVAGGVSGALAAGAAAAVAGSVAPGVGTAIGFVVGVGAYLLVDWLAGDAVESGVRSVAR